MATIVEALQQGVALQQSGRLAEAARCYEAVLQVDPQQPDALHLSGLILSEQGRHVEAIERVHRALAASPKNPVFLANLGVLLRKADRLEEAVAAYREALAIAPDVPDTHFNLGKSLKLIGDSAGAEAAFRRALELNPKKPSPWLSWMNLIADRGDLQGAIDLGRRALEHCPKSAEVYLNLGVMLKRAAQTAESQECYRQAVAVDPNNVDALCKLAALLIDRQNLQEGEQLLKRAHSLAPNHPEVHNAVGIWHKKTGDTAAAIAAFRKAIAGKADHGAAHSNLATALKDQGLLSDALEHAEEGLRLQPGSCETLVNRAAILMSLGRLEDAAADLQRAVDLRGGYAEAHQSLLMCQQYQLGTTAAKLAESHRQWDQRYAAAADRRPLDDVDRDPQRPLRLGFVSADLGSHPVGYFTVRLFEAMSPERLVATVYSDRGEGDAISARIAARTTWLNSSAWSDDELYERIRADRIDLLFDLAGHTAHNRLRVFARRAAPVQITWAGYVGTTGVSQMDYLLADRWHVPEGEEQAYVERVLRMPHGYICYDTPEAAPAVGELPALTKGGVTFASMCNPAKVNPQVLQAWGRILAALPTARLIVCYRGWPDPANRRRVDATLSQYGCAHRVELQQLDNHLEVLARYNDVDIALDTFPYSGGLTTCEALWMGVPTITWPGKTFAGRHTCSHLMNVGLSEWVAADEDDYVHKAVGWAQDPARLSAVRRQLREQVASSPLCDGRLFAANFEEACRAAWRRFCEEG